MFHFNIVKIAVLCLPFLPSSIYAQTLPPDYAPPYQSSYPEPASTGPGPMTPALATAIIRKHVGLSGCISNTKVLSVKTQVGAMQHILMAQHADHPVPAYPVRSDVVLTCRIGGPLGTYMVNFQRHEIELTFSFYRNSFGEWGHTRVGANFSRLRWEYYAPSGGALVVDKPQTTPMLPAGDIPGLTPFKIR